VLGSRTAALDTPRLLSEMAIAEVGGEYQLRTAGLTKDYFGMRQQYF